MPIPIIILHGGNTFPSQEAYVEDLRTKEIQLERLKPSCDWKTSISRELGSEYAVYAPRMPLSDNADYELWKLWFMRVYEAIHTPSILIGHSLGAMFLLKYLSENKLPFETPALFLVAPYFTNKAYPDREQSSFTLENTTIFDEKVKKIIFFHSTDDLCVPFESFELFKEYYKTAEFKEFTDRGHFNTEYFPELVVEIKKLS